METISKRRVFKGAQENNSIFLYKFSDYLFCLIHMSLNRHPQRQDIDISCHCLDRYN